MELTNDVPPKLIKVSGIPVIGKTPMTTPMLINAWMVIKRVSEIPKYFKNKLLALKEIKKPLKNKIENRMMTEAPSNNPPSSHKTEKMKSE